MAALAPLLGENLGMELASIEHVDEGRRHRVKVGDAVEVDIEDVVSPFDPDGPPPKLTETKHPANSDLTPATTLSARIRGLGIEYSAVPRADSRRRHLGLADALVNVGRIRSATGSLIAGSACDGA